MIKKLLRICNLLNMKIKNNLFIRKIIYFEITKTVSLSKIIKSFLFLPASIYKELETWLRSKDETVKTDKISYMLNYAF